MRRAQGGVQWGRWRAAILLGGVGIVVLHLVNRATIEWRWFDVNREWTPLSLLNGLLILSVTAAVLRAWRRGLLAPPIAVMFAALATYLALDEVLSFHERLGEWVTDTLGLGVSWDSVVWPALYAPLLGVVALLALLCARRAGGEVWRTVCLGLALLVAAVLLEIADAPFSTPERGGGSIDAVSSGLEEACEMSGWAAIGIGLWLWAGAGGSAGVEVGGVRRRQRSA